MILNFKEKYFWIFEVNFFLIKENNFFQLLKFKENFFKFFLEIKENDLFFDFFLNNLKKIFIYLFF